MKGESVEYGSDIEGSLDELRKEILKKFLTKEARERLARVKIVKPRLVRQIELYLLQMYQAGRIKGTITEEEIKKLLESLSEKRSGSGIKILRK